MAVRNELGEIDSDRQMYLWGGGSADKSGVGFPVLLLRLKPFARSCIETAAGSWRLIKLATLTIRRCIADPVRAA